MKLTIGEKDININISLPGGIVTILTTVFVVLKVLGEIDWSWVWVLSPLWISAAIALLIILIVILVIFIIARRF